MTLKFHHVDGQIPEDILGVYTYLLVRDHFPHANLDVIVRDIAKVMIFHCKLRSTQPSIHGTEALCTKSNT
jgi:hypothetical protein